ncbi:la-related protein 1C-like isoform X1 [Syzygium oleosum]|uniref:la-related protein 1C-like isoform X1 n=1 Tax=Syzygium oleosum TaxID=219896 RepID=UPI0024BBAFEE|nr:la-related protein 1C-like isoform X1 [Syzygium oleosum]
MAASADPPSSHHFPRGSDPAAGSPRSRRKNLPSPRSQVARLEPEAPSPSPSPPPRSPAAAAWEQAPCSPRRSALQPEVGSEESSDGSGGNVVSVQPKKPAWNKPSSEAVDAGPVMGDAVSWPALSESARASPKSLSIDPPSSKAASVESVPNSQVRLEISPGPPVLHSPQKQAASNNLNANSTSNNSPTARQKLNRRGGGANSNFPNAYGQGGFAHHPIPPPPPPPLPHFPVFHPNPYGTFIRPIANTTVRDPTYKGNNWDVRPARGFVSPAHVMTDHRNSSRRGNSGPHHRGDGSPRNSNNNGTRRDKDRGNFSGARDLNVQPHRANPRGFVRSSPPLPTSPPFVGPPPMRPLVPMNFSDITPQFYIPALPMEPYSGGPFFPPPPSTPMFMPVSDPSLPSHIVHQIEYYFSDDNLVKDEFLKAKMDTEGWVPISLIASFPRVMSLTTNIHLILESLRDSTVVEVQDDKVRRRNEWAKWIYRGSLASRSSSYDELATSFEKMTAEEVPANQNDMTGEADVHRDAVSRYSPKSTDQVQHPDTVGIDY